MPLDTWPQGMAGERAGGEVLDRPNVLFSHVDNLGFGELSRYSGGPFRGAQTYRIDRRGAVADRPLVRPHPRPVSRMLEAKRGDPEVAERDQLTLEVRRDCDLEYLRRAEAFIRRTVGAGTPFFVDFNHSLMHLPVIPRAEFQGRSGRGDWVDALLELDADLGSLLDLLDELGVAGDTLVVFAGDNGPEDLLLWRGTPGYWEGSYFAGGEGNLRTPCLVRWPGHIPPGSVSDEIMPWSTGSPPSCARPGWARRPTGDDGVDSSTGSPTRPAARSGRATSTGWGRRWTGPSGATSS
jgi:Sulfatase